MDPDEIIINPCAKILPALGDEVVASYDLDSIDGLFLSVPLRGQPLKRHAVRKATDRGLFNLFCEILAADGDLELDLTDAQEEYLLRIGFLTPRRSVPDVVRYSCFLDADELADLSVRATEPPSARLIVNPSLLFLDNEAAFERLRGRVCWADSFLPGHPMLWIEDPGTSVLAPYWLRGRTIDVARSLIPGEPAPSNLDPEIERCLRAADILVPEDHRERRAAEVERALNEARSQHAELGYGVLRDFIPPLHVAAMNRHFRRLIDNGYVPLGDTIVKVRYHLHSEPVSVFFHGQLGGMISHVIGQPHKPTYCYIVQYEQGSVLRRHTDRIQAEYTLSIQIAYDPAIEAGEKTPWPIYVEAKGATAEIRLGIGEGALYRGHELPHYRKELPGVRSTSFFFHYVYADYQGPLR